jgi:hypothetical protein
VGTVIEANTSITVDCARKGVPIGQTGENRLQFPNGMLSLATLQGSAQVPLIEYTEASVGEAAATELRRDVSKLQQTAANLQNMMNGLNDTLNEIKKNMTNGPWPQLPQHPTLDDATSLGLEKNGKTITNAYLPGSQPSLATTNDYSQLEGCEPGMFVTDIGVWFKKPGSVFRIWLGCRKVNINQQLP